MTLSPALGFRHDEALLWCLAMRCKAVTTSTRILAMKEPRAHAGAHTHTIFFHILTFAHTHVRGPWRRHFPVKKH